MFIRVTAISPAPNVVVGTLLVNYSRIAFIGPVSPDNADVQTSDQTKPAAEISIDGNVLLVFETPDEIERAIIEARTNDHRWMKNL